MTALHKNRSECNKGSLILSFHTPRSNHQTCTTHAWLTFSASTTNIGDACTMSTALEVVRKLATLHTILAGVRSAGGIILGVGLKAQEARLAFSATTTDIWDACAMGAALKVVRELATLHTI